jgi:hypothetical protein
MIQRYLHSLELSESRTPKSSTKAGYNFGFYTVGRDITSKHHHPMIG